MKEKTIKVEICKATMKSLAVPGHVHKCNGTHDIMDDSHWCAEPGCGRWFWQALPVRSTKESK